MILQTQRGAAGRPLPNIQRANKVCKVRTRNYQLGYHHPFGVKSILDGKRASMRNRRGILVTSFLSDHSGWSFIVRKESGLLREDIVGRIIDSYLSKVLKSQKGSFSPNSIPFTLPCSQFRGRRSLILIYLIAHEHMLMAFVLMKIDVQV